VGSLGLNDQGARAMMPFVLLSYGLSYRSSMLAVGPAHTYTDMLMSI
jgi:hypothetical protein